MTRPSRRQNEYDVDPEGPGREDADLLDESQTGVRVCPECGRSIYEGAGRCNHCGHWIVREPWDAPDHPRRRKVLLAIVSIIALLAFLLWLLL